MRTVPSEIPSSLKNDLKMSAERRVFNALKNTNFGDHAAAIHSLRLAEHEYKREGELDFVIVSRFGLYVLEVKGGGVRRDKNGVWYYTDRYGNEREDSEGPFDQASSGMYSLKEDLFDHFGSELRSKLVYGFGVITPDTGIPNKTPEWDARQVADASDLSGVEDLQSFLGGLRQYYKERYKANRRGASKLFEDDISNIVDYLRPRFDKATSLVHQIGNVRDVLQSLTKEQYRCLDYSEGNERILCKGGAGTGKTFLAMEVARRESARGRSVLLTCRSKSLSRYLGERVVDDDVQVMDTADVAESAGEVKYDTLVVDEGQDVLTTEHLAEIFSMVEGGIQKGRWRFFYDPNRQSDFYENTDPEALDLLRDAQPASISLSMNCRNPAPVIRKTQLFTGGDLGTPQIGDGPEVETVFTMEGDDVAGELAVQLRKLSREGVSPGSVVILSPLPFEESSAAELPKDLRSEIRPLDSATAGDFPFDRVAFSSIRNFKGFEGDAVILIDLKSDLADPSLENLLYVALSRTRAYLSLLLPRSMEEEVKSLIRKHASKIVEAE